MKATSTLAQHSRFTFDPAQPIPPQLPRIDTERLDRYRANRAFYEGKQWATRAAPKNARQITLNYTRAFILKTVSYLLHGRAVTVEPVDKSDPASLAIAAAAERLIRDLQARNETDANDYAAEVDAAVDGDGAFKITWSTVAQMPVVSSPDVADTWWVRAWDDPSRLALVVHRYQPGPLLPHATEGSPNPLVEAARRSATGTVTEVWTPESVEYWADHTQHVATIDNTWGTVPFVIFPNSRISTLRPEGTADVELLSEPAREVNRAFSQLSNIMELSGNPIAVLENVDEQGGIEVAPGQVWAIPEGARAYVLDLLSKGAGDAHLAYLNQTQQRLHDLGESPRTAWGDNSRQLSGRALEMELDPLGKLIARKRAVRTAAYRRRDELMLLALELFAPGMLEQRGIPSLEAVGRIGYVWGQVLATDRSQIVADEVALVAAGIHSRQGASGNLGDVDPEGEWQRTLSENEAIPIPAQQGD